MSKTKKKVVTIPFTPGIHPGCDNCHHKSRIAGTNPCDTSDNVEKRKPEGRFRPVCYKTASFKASPYRKITKTSSEEHRAS